MSNVENDVRMAAARLHEAIQKARAGGLHVVWPNRPEGLLSIAVSETGRAKVDVTVQGVEPAIAGKAASAAQKAADRVVEKASDKA